MDTALRVPGTSFRVGLDPLLGLFPAVGDVISGALASYIVLVAWRRGASAAVVGRMLANIGIDTVVGAIPAVGDVFDAAFKSNVRNLALLERYVAAPAVVEKRSARMALLAAGVIGAIAIGLGFATVFVAETLWRLLTS